MLHSLNTHECNYKLCDNPSNNCLEIEFECSDHVNITHFNEVSDIIIHSVCHGV